MKQFSKPYIVSLSGLSLEDNVIMIKKALEKPSVAGIELNLACPNIPGKPVIAYDFEQLESVLATVTAIPNLKSKPFGVKLAPYFDMLHFDRAISILSKYPIQFVVTTNTIGNCLFVDADNECASIAPKGGLGGLGGGYIKPVALANVRMISQKLIEYNRTDIDVIGVGGVSTGRDAFELILCGAKAVQVGTCHWTEGPVCFERISEELIDIMRTKGYTSIEDFRGKLKAYTKSSSASKSVANADKDDESGMKNGSGSVFMISEIIYQSLIVLLFAALLYAHSRSK